MPIHGAQSALLMDCLPRSFSFAPPTSHGQCQPLASAPLSGNVRPAPADVGKPLAGAAQGSLERSTRRAGWDRPSRFVRAAHVAEFRAQPHAVSWMCSWLSRC